MAFFKAEVMDI